MIQRLAILQETILLFHGAFMKRRIAAQFRLRLCLTYLTEEVKFGISFHFFAYTKPKLSNYLDSVLMGLKFFSEKKEVVTANQFGTHSWFS